MKPLYTISKGFLSKEECDLIVASFSMNNIGFVMITERGEKDVVRNQYIPEIRTCDLSNFDTSHFVFEKARRKFMELKEVYGLSDLGGIAYNFVRYREGGKFAKHTDAYENMVGSHRQLSMSVQLTNTHEGGQFVIYKPGTDEPKYPKLEQGDALLFKSTLMHEVQPITKGERYALVLWFMTKE